MNKSPDFAIKDFVCSVFSHMPGVSESSSGVLGHVTMFVSTQVGAVGSPYDARQYSIHIHPS